MLKIIIGIVTISIILNSCQTENKDILQKFISEKPNILVCPVHILDNQYSFYDTSCSNKIVDYINNKNYATASLTRLIPPANNDWSHNEAKMLTISINNFIEFIKKSNLPDDTYILYPEFLKAGKYSNVIGIHYCILNNKGDIAMKGLLNSHWKEFQKVNPKDNDDCVNVLISGIEVKMSTKY